MCSLFCVNTLYVRNVFMLQSSGDILTCNLCYLGQQTYSDYLLWHFAKFVAAYQNRWQYGSGRVSRGEKQKMSGGNESPSTLIARNRARVIANLRATHSLIFVATWNTGEWQRPRDAPAKLGLLIKLCIHGRNPQGLNKLCLSGPGMQLTGSLLY